ncbi:hypothetical protein [Pseudomonas sp. GM50]|uniref:hypothetical protein n=1 Tax=Pseudomonas sp. GM50 TaxID=1144332 RepID=UPI0012F66F41|nr:hypothetical protein [Pseudomonas sp. GM50]
MNKSPVARGLAPVGLRSGPKTVDPDFPDAARLNGFASAAQPNGGKPPRHKGFAFSNLQKQQSRSKAALLVWITA